MAEQSVSRMLQLRKELSELENSPKIQDLLAKQETLIRKLEELDLDKKDAAEMLVPQVVAGASGPMVELAGKRRIPVAPGRKMLMQSELLAIRGEVDELLQRLEKDPVVQKRSQLMDTLSELGISYMDAAELLSPGIQARISDGQKSGTKGGRRKAKYWMNPHSKEVVKARSTSNRTLQAWVDEHGKAILDEWRIPEEQAPKELRED